MKYFNRLNLNFFSFLLEIFFHFYWKFFFKNQAKNELNSSENKVF